MTAASQPITDPSQMFKPTTGVGIGATSTGWQEIAWDMLDMVGELRYYVGWRSAACSRTKLIASELDDEGVPTGKCSNDRVKEIVKAIAGGRLGQAQMVRRLVECLSVPGEVWVAIVMGLPGGPPAGSWLPLSRDEIQTKGKIVTITLPDGTKHDLNLRPGPTSDSLFRIWNPRPRRAYEPESAVRAALDPLYEIVRTTKTIANASKSRLIGNGIVLVPQEMSLPTQATPVSAAKPGDPTIPAVNTPAVTQLQELLFQVAQTAYDDPDSMAALIPIMAGVPAEMVDKVSHIKFDNEVTVLAIQTRNDAITRLAMALDVSPERLLGLGSSTNHWCSDEETQALTQRGWLRYDQITVGDEVLTLNHDTGLSEWKPVLDLYRANVVDEPMREMTTQRHNSLTTMAHRWPVLRPRGTSGRASEHVAREWTTTEELASAHSIVTAVPSADVPAEAKYTDDLVELIAWYWTEGSLSQQGQMTIAQSHTVNDDQVMRIRAVLTRLFGSAQPGRGGTWSEWRQENSASHGGPVTVFGISKSVRDMVLDIVPGRDKIVPTWWIRQLTGAQLRLFVEVSCAGDGWHLRHGVTDIWQKNPAALDAFELALILSGVAVSRHSSGDGEAVRALKATTQRPGKDVNGHRKFVTQVYSGVVWCPTTENQTWFARRHGQTFYTGNSAWQIGDTDVQLHIAPVMELIVQAITKDILSVVLESEGIDADQYVLWYDTGGLTSDPDKSDQASDAFDRGAITAEAYREFLNLGDTGYDLVNGGLSEWQRWAADRVSQDPTLLQPLMPLLPAAIEGLDFPTPVPALPPAPADNTDVEDDTGDSETQGDGQPGSEGAPPPSERETRSIDSVSAFERVFVTRALELAGKRRATRADRGRLSAYKPHEYHRMMPPVDPAQVPDLIRGWDATLEDDVIEMTGVDSETFRARVRAEVRRQLTAQMVNA